MVVSFLRWLSRWDTFGHRINLRVKDQDSLQTSCGSIIAICVFAFFLVQAESLCSRLIMQIDPFIKTYDVHEVVEQPINLVDNRMPLAFRIQKHNGDNSNYIDPRAGKLTIK